MSHRRHLATYNVLQYASLEGMKMKVYVPGCFWNWVTPFYL